MLASTGAVAAKRNKRGFAGAGYETGRRELAGGAAQRSRKQVAPAPLNSPALSVETTMTP